jgi:hypothetical protein
MKINESHLEVRGVGGKGPGVNPIFVREGDVGRRVQVGHGREPEDSIGDLTRREERDGGGGGGGRGV